MMSFLQTPEVGVSAGVAGLIASVYWLMMFIGRSVGGSIGGMVSSRVMVSTVATAAIILLAFGTGPIQGFATTWMFLVLTGLISLWYGQLFPSTSLPSSWWVCAPL